MSVTSDLPIPADTQILSFGYVPTLEIGQISKSFRGDFDVFESLEKHYRKNQTLRPIVVDRVDTSHSKFVKKVYQRVIAEAKEFPDSAEELKRSREKHASTVASLRLQEIVEWTKESKKAQDTIIIFETVAKQLSAAQDYLDELDTRRDLTVIEGAHEICQWMNQHQETLARIEDLDLSNLRLTYLPPEIGLFRGLIRLNLFNNQLTIVPEELGNLNRLRMLNLSNNQLTVIPAILGNLRQLEVLYLHHNKLTVIPVELGNLTALEILFLSYNKLTELPVELGNLTSLNELYLQVNKLSVIPEWFGNLGALKLLNLSYNQLSEVAIELGNLSQLKSLWLNNNRLRALPVELRNLSALKVFFLHGNLQALAPPAGLVGLRTN